MYLIDLCMNMFLCLHFDFIIFRKDQLIVDHFAISDIQLDRLPIATGEYALLTTWKLNGIDAAYTHVFAMYN